MSLQEQHRLLVALRFEARDHAGALRFRRCRLPDSPTPDARRRPRHP
jgi:hypothetical protein